MKRFALLLALLWCGAAPSWAFDLTILHTNDVHAMWGGTTANGTACYAPSCEGGKGGSLRLKQAVDALRAANPDTVLLDAGDEFQGTLFYNRFKSEVPAGVLDRIGYDAFVPGNHEFDDACGEFQRFVQGMHVPVVAANLSLPSKADGKPLVSPWVIVKRGDRRIGIVGLANEETPSLSSPCREASFGPAEAALTGAVRELREQGVNIIIALTHLGLDVDTALAERVEGVDVFVGGHTHSVLSNTDPKAVGPYPVVRKSPSGEPVLVVTAGTACKLLGHLLVSFDEAGVAKSWQGEPVVLDGKGDVPPDSGLAAFLDGYGEQLRAFIAQPVGKIIAPSGRTSLQRLEDDAHVCRAQECMSGDIVVDALLGAVRDTGATIALLVGGGIRSPLPVGVVTMGNVLETLPFDNTVVVADMTGKQILDALEHGASEYAQGAGRFLQTSGLSYTVDPAGSAGHRVSSVKIWAKAGWRPLHPENVYRVATVDYMAEGGDGYAMFKTLKWQYTGLSQSDVVRDFIAAAPVQAKLGGRIIIR